MGPKVNSSILLAAVLATVSPIASAQFRVGDDGHANDANPRIGSGGFNQSLPSSALIDANKIITGNVTGGKAFHVPVTNGYDNRPYKDVNEFRGNLGSASLDNFFRNSAGVPAPYQAAAAPGQSEVFYGRALAASPPAGYVANGYTGTFTPGASVASTVQTNPNPNPSPRAIDNELRNANLLPQPGELLMPGPVDPQTNRPTVTTASPLLGVRRWDLEELLRPNASGYPSAAPAYLGPPVSFDPTKITEMRRELAQSITRDLTLDPTAPANARPLQSGALDNRLDSNRNDNAASPRDPNAPQSSTPGANLARPAPQPFETPQNPAIGNRPLNNELEARPLANELGRQAEQGNLPGAAQQSAQMSELQRRLQRYYTERLGAEQPRVANARGQGQRRDSTAARAPVGESVFKNGEAAPTMRVPNAPDFVGRSREVSGLRPNITPGLPTPAAPTTRPTNIPAPEPMKIQSLAEGVRAAGLAGLLKNAEDLMKQGKYSSAIEQYQAASAVAPNNALASLGQAHAELAAGYYRRAEQRIRATLQSDPTLLLGQFDLKQMIGEERLRTAVSDLKDLATRQPNDDGPVLMLAYLAYNTGVEGQAATYLDAAEKRADAANADTDIYKVLRAHWKLPAAANNP